MRNLRKGKKEKREEKGERLSVYNSVFRARRRWGGREKRKRRAS